MKIIIIGNGVAGTFSALNIRALDKNVKIKIYSREKYPYYTRVKLPELISGKLGIQDLIVFKDSWYQQQKIDLILETKVQKINPSEKKIIISSNDGSEDIFYDKLIIATGAIPNIPPIKNANELLGKGVFTLRMVDNALEIKEYIEKNGVKKGIIIGGGLLGLELAKQIKDCGIDTTVVEFFPRLLPRQLDADCGDMLKEIIEEMGIKVVLNAATEEILGKDDIDGIKLKNGTIIKGEIVLIQAGIRTTVDLAVNAGIKVNRGIIVNEFLETNVNDIYAVGDCAEFNGRVYGIIPACMEQAKIIASSVLGKKDLKYNGTTPKNTLKIVGIDLTSIGIFDPEDKDQIGAGWEILKIKDEKGKCYKKIVLNNDILKGAIVFGDKKPITYLNKNIEHKINENELREVMEFYKWICGNCGFEYDDAKMEILFQNLPDDWTCVCGAPKSNFNKKNHQ
ncbi:MAG: FAD-dependent oxidoreductase [Promethearchaeota archaeon]